MKKVPLYSAMKKILFYSSSLILVPFILLLDCVLALCEFLTRGSQVLHMLLARYEHWAFNVPKGTFFNCPWKRTLREEYDRNYY